MSIASQFVQSLIEMPGKFAEVAMQGPIEGLLVLFGALFVGAPLLYFGYLSTGAILAPFLPESFGAEHPEE